MNKEKGDISGFQKILAREVAIDFKACLYFFCILFFYCTYRVIQGCIVADILHMAEMILVTYLMGYFQVYLLNNFDEAESLGKRELAQAIGCSALYGLISWFLKWFAQSVYVTIGFVCFMLVCYICIFLCYKVKRVLDTRELNEQLRAFKANAEKTTDRTGEDDYYGYQKKHE